LSESADRANSNRKAKRKEKKERKKNKRATFFVRRFAYNRPKRHGGVKFFFLLQTSFFSFFE